MIIDTRMLYMVVPRVLMSIFLARKPAWAHNVADRQSKRVALRVHIEVVSFAQGR